VPPKADPFVAALVPTLLLFQSLRFNAPISLSNPPKASICLFLVSLRSADAASFG
jgi:hypothetical protein